ncbi:MAG: serine/threonine protein kinase [Planctomycetaceae bacterium]|nr:serine/threonine protein kinase [Planctomycetaceae bacterium]
MTEDRQKKAMSIFLRITEVDDSSRTPLLDQECGSDRQLRKEVESLLRHHTTQTLISSKHDTFVTPPSHNAVKNRRKTFIRQASIGIKRQRNALLAAGAMVLIIVATAAWAFTKVRSSLQQSVERQLTTVLDAEIKALELWIDVRQEEATVWAQNDEVRSLVKQLEQAVVEKQPTRQAVLNDAFLALLEPLSSQKGHQGLAIVNLAGRFIAGSEDLLNRVVNEKATPYLSKLAEGKAFFVIPSKERRYVAGIHSPIRDPSVTIGAPVFDSNGNVIAGLCFGFDADEEFDRIFSVANADSNGDTYAFESNALLISNLSNRTNEKWVQELKLIPSTAVQTALNLKIVDPGFDLTVGQKAAATSEQQPTEIVQRALATRKQKTATIVKNVQGYRNYLGVEVVGAAKWLDEWRFGVATEMPMKDAFAPLRYVTSAFIFLIASVTLLALGLLVSALSLIRMRDRIGEAERLGAYQLQQLIGEGGMGRVYKAQHALLKREAAVKLLDGLDSNQETIDRFEREVQLTCQLTHPNTIQIYDYGRSETGVFYYAMEYLPGITLEQLVALVGQIPPARVINLLSQVCASLTEAHEVGLIHRDIKPANVMLCNRGGIADFAKVLDFGIAKKLDPEHEITHHDSVVGTPHYIAPERISNGSQVDSRSDLYSVGCVGFYLLTGSTPFQADSPVKLFHQLLNKTAPAPSKRTTQPVPVELDQIIFACLAQEPNERPASAKAMRHVLDELKEQHPWTQDEAHAWWNGFRTMKSSFTQTDEPFSP